MPQLRPKPEDINAAYRDGYITASGKNAKMRALAHDNLADLIDNQGMLIAYWKQSAKHLQSGWDDLVKIATESDPSKSSWENVKHIGSAMLAQVEILTAPLSAFGEVNGKKAEMIALQAGMSPGLAKFVNIGVDLSSGLLPVGQGMRLFAKGIQKNIPQLAAGIDKIKGAGKAGEAAKEAVSGNQAEKLVEDALEASLKVEGVDAEVLRRGKEFLANPNKTLAESTTMTRTPDDVTAEILKRGQEFLGGDDFYKELRKFRAEMGKISERKTHAMTQVEADKLGLNIDDLKALLGNKALTEAEMLSYLNALDGPTQKWLATAQRVIAGDPDAPAQFRKLAQDYFSYLPKFRQAEVTAGRAVEILKEQPPAKAISDMLIGWDPESMAKLDIDAATRTMAEDILSLASEPEKLKTLQLQGSNAIRDGHDWWGMSKEAWRNLLLARPITWSRTFLGNLLATSTRTIERETAGWLSIDERAGVMRGEGLQAFYGQMASIGEAFGAFGSALKKAPDVTRFDEQLNKIPGAAGRLINTPTGIVAGLDNMFKTVARTSDFYAISYRDGKRAADELKLTGDAYHTYIADFMARRRIHPTAEMRQHAETIAIDDTFQSELGKMGKNAQGLLQTGPLYYYFTFVKSGINLIKWGLEHAPATQFFSKQLYKDILAGGEAADMAIAKLTLGTMAGQFYYGLHQTGLMTSGGPTDVQLRRAWMANNRPYSLMGGDGTAYPYKNVGEPISTVAELVGDFAEIHNQLDEPTAENTATAVGVTLTKDALENTWWRTAGDIADILGGLRSGEGVGDKAIKLASSPIVGALTLGPLGQGLVRANDPIMRETKTALDQIKNGVFGRIFGYGDNPVPVRDGYGDPVLVPQAIGAKWLREQIPFAGGMLAGALNLSSPFTQVTQREDRIKKEGDVLQAKLPPFPWSTGGGSARDDFDIRSALPGEAVPVPLTSQQRDRWQVIYRNILLHPEYGIEKQLLDTDEYKNGPWALKREAFMNYLGGVREGAKGSLMVEDIDLAKKVAQATAGRYLPMIQPEERPAVQQQITQSLDLFDTLLPKERDNLLRWGFLDSGAKRDEEVTGVKMSIDKPINELNAAAAAARGNQ